MARLIAVPSADQVLSGIFEVLDMNERIKGMVKASVDLADLAVADYDARLETLGQVAIRKMMEGVTTYEEVISMAG